MQTISDSKGVFHKEFPYVIPGLYRKFADELLVELHLLSHQKDFELNKIFSIGLNEVFNVFTIGYTPEKHKSQMLKALCIANNLNPEEIANQSEEYLQELESKSIEDVKNSLSAESSEKSLKRFYSRITTIGLYKVVQVINVSKNTEVSKLNEDLSSLVKVYGYEENRVERDINIFKTNISKMEQALKIINMNKK